MERGLWWCGGGGGVWGRGSVVTQRGELVMKPGVFFHVCGNALCECCHLTLEVDEKVI